MRNLARDGNLLSAVEGVEEASDPGTALCTR
jgi:hypothetical protein